MREVTPETAADYLCETGRVPRGRAVAIRALGRLERRDAGRCRGGTAVRAQAGVREAAGEGAMHAETRAYPALETGRWPTSPSSTSSGLIFITGRSRVHPAIAPRIESLIESLAHPPWRGFVHADFSPKHSVLGGLQRANQSAGRQLLRPPRRRPRGGLRTGPARRQEPN
jgi:hypothetical protein